MTKSLKLDHELAEMVRRGEKTSTWRIFDDKNISEGDAILFIDKVVPTRPDSWREIGTYKVVRVIEKPLGSICEEDFSGHEKFQSPGIMIKTYRKYYGPTVDESTPVKMIHFTKLA